MADPEREARAADENAIDRAFRRMDEARAAARPDPVIAVLRLADRAVGGLRDSMDRWLGELQLQLSVRQARRDPGHRAWNDEITRGVHDGSIHVAVEERDPILAEVEELQRKERALLEEWARRQNRQAV